MRTVRILPKKQLLLLLHRHMRIPRLPRLRVPTPRRAIQRILQMKRHILLAIDVDLLLVAKARDVHAVNEELPVREDDTERGGGAMAQKHDGAVLLVELADQGEGVGVVDEVEHGAEAADVEDGGELGCFAEEGGEREGGGPEGGVGFVEGDADGVVFEEVD